MVGKPTDTVLKITCLPRWQREWVNNHRSLNYSGLVQTMLNEVIKQNDPIYFQKHQSVVVRITKRKENIDAVVSSIEII